MGLFDKIFKRKTDPKIENENLPSFWEDDYCQIEIAPRKNVEHISHSIKEINKFSEKASNEYGFTDIYGRDGLPFPTINEEFRIDAFENLLTKKGFEKALKIRYDASIIIDCSNTNTNAFSLSCFNLFYDCEEGFLKNIWVSTSLASSNEHFDKISDTLYELGEGYELVLIDWNSLELIDLADRNQIKSYLMNYRR